jgi:hypothetical protein
MLVLESIFPLNLFLTATTELTKKERIVKEEYQKGFEIKIE